MIGIEQVIYAANIVGALREKSFALQATKEMIKAVYKTLYGYRKEN